MLHLDGIQAGYTDAPVLHDVTLHVPAGTVVALLGANGAGKTTLLRVATGLLRPTRGRVLVDACDRTGNPVRDFAVAGVCHVPEGRAVFPSLTVRQNIALFSVAGQERDGLDRAVDAFPRLGQRLDQQAGTMSGGEQQMLALTRAYVQQYRYVLLDEVSMGLAPKVVEEIFAFLQRLAAEGTALLLVEQYIGVALELADIAHLLHHGRLVLSGEAAGFDADAVSATYLGTTT